MVRSIVLGLLAIVSCNAVGETCDRPEMRLERVYGESFGVAAERVRALLGSEGHKPAAIQVMVRETEEGVVDLLAVTPLVASGYQPLTPEWQMAAFYECQMQTYLLGGPVLVAECRDQLEATCVALSLWEEYRPYGVIPVEGGWRVFSAEPDVHEPLHPAGARVAMGALEPPRAEKTDAVLSRPAVRFLEFVHPWPDDSAWESHAESEGIYPLAIPMAPFLEEFEHCGAWHPTSFTGDSEFQFQGELEFVRSVAFATPCMSELFWPYTQCVAQAGELWRHGIPCALGISNSSFLLIDQSVSVEATKLTQSGFVIRPSFEDE